MKQAADVRPEPTFARKAAIATGGAADHAGAVRVLPIPDFDLDRTIFSTLEGTAARFVMKTRVGKEAHWDDAAGKAVQAKYDRATAELQLPAVDPALLKFMVEQCNFDVEHADGSFLDHLYFCFEYSALHFPDHSPLVMLLHSILGTGTNTFAMTADKIPGLRPLMSEFEWRHVEAFPSVLRLLYSGGLPAELRANLSRLSSLEEIRFRRVIDNEPVTLAAEDLWIQLNYQLIHLVDFLPVANWAVHANDTSFILFRELYDLLGRAGKRWAKIDYSPATGPRTLQREPQGVGEWLTTLIPVALSAKMAAKSVQKFSARIGHSLAYELVWAAD